MKIAEVKSIRIAGILLVCLLLYVFTNRYKSDPAANQPLLTEEVVPRSFDIEVRSVGELEASRSHLIMSPIRGDLGKIIYLIADGTTVKTGDLLVKLDPTPFEEEIADLKHAILEQECQVKALAQAIESEICQSQHEEKSGEFEVRSATLELEKIVKGDGPQEMARLQSLMQKALVKFEEISTYSKELTELEKEGFLNPSEVLHAKKKLQDEEEAYNIAKLEYDAFINYVYPMRVEKANTALKRAASKLEETSRIAAIKVARNRALLEHAHQQLLDLNTKLQTAQNVLSMTDMTAPAAGIVVLREEYRSGQKRKPRIGDIVIRNQPILDLPDLDSMIVKTKVREADLYKIQVGEPAIITLDAYPQMHLQGKVLSIGVLALADVSKMGDEKYFDVIVGLDEGDARIRPGMTARIVVLAEQVKDKLTVPIHAVFEMQNTNFCYVAKGNRFIRQDVKLGSCNEQWVEIISGLKKNDQVALVAPPKSAIQD